MSGFLIALVTGIYAFVAIDLARRGEWMGLTFAGYAIANIGILLDLSPKGGGARAASDISPLRETLRQLPIAFRYLEPGIAGLGIQRFFGLFLGLPGLGEVEFLLLFRIQLLAAARLIHALPWMVIYPRTATNPRLKDMQFWRGGHVSPGCHVAAAAACNRP
jgi:hypothetical protein